MMDLKSHMQQLEKALGESFRAIAEIMCTQPQSQGEASQSFKHLETKQIRTDCPISVRQMTKAGFSGDNDGMMVEWTLSAFTEAAYTGTVFQGRT